MGKHYFGMKDGDFRGRFYKGFTDEEFYKLVEEIGGELPKGIFAWHFDDGETVKNSKRVQAVAQLPIVTSAIGRWIDPAEYLPKLVVDQVQARLARL